MAYELVQNRNDQFAVDWDIVRRLLKSYYTASLQNNSGYSSEVTMSDSHWYNPFSWSLPDLSHIEVNWEQVRRDAESKTDDNLAELKAKAKFDAAAVANGLDGSISAAAVERDEFLNWMRGVQKENMHSINQAVEDYQSHIEVARFVRGSSAEALMVGASVMSGGAATAVMAGGSLLKGVGEFEDTGSVGAGVMEATGSFAFAYIKLGQKFSLKEDMVLALVQAEWKDGTELVAGKSVGEAALAGGLKLTGPIIDRAFRIGPAKTLFDKIAVPVVITYDGKNVASEFLSKFSAKMVQKWGVEKAGKRLITGLFSSDAAQGGGGDPSSENGIIDQVTLTNSYLLELGFVNMSKGIGNGW